MNRTLQFSIAIFALLMLANLAYALKSILGIDLTPGHHGNLFPLGDLIWRRARHMALTDSSKVLHLRWSVQKAPEFSTHR